MPRFYFDIERADLSSLDDEGLDFDSLDEARQAAVGLLPDLARDEVADRTSLLLTSTVRNEAGQSVFRATLSLTAQWLDRPFEHAWFDPMDVEAVT